MLRLYTFTILRLFVFTFIFWLFFWLTNWACTNNFTSWSSTPYPSNAISSWACRSNATAGTERYNNQNPIDGENALIFLKMFNFSPDLNCDSFWVANIQTKMQQIWWSCSTCIDGKAWNSTRTRMADCPGLACPSPSKPPTIENDILVCELWYELDNSNCCIPQDCSWPWKSPINNAWWCDDPNSIVQNWCCEALNITHQIIITANPNSFQDLNTQISISVDFWEWVDTNARDCDQINVTNVDTPARLWNQSTNQSLECQTTVTPKDFQNIVITSSAWVVKYIDWIDSSTAKETVTSWIAWCLPPQIITWWVCQCPNWSTLKNWACCQDSGTWEVCTCPWWKVYENNQCVCPKLKKDDWNWKCVCDPAQWCCWIELNTVVPFIWDCIEMSDEWSSANTTRVNPLNAFPRLMWWLSRILVTAILVLSFVMVVVWWVMIIAWWIKESNFSEWKKYIRQVVIWLILLWASWIILRLINPNFFW